MNCGVDLAMWPALPPIRVAESTNREVGRDGISLSQSSGGLVLAGLG